MGKRIEARSSRGAGYGIAIVNPQDRDAWMRTERYLFWFGAYGTTRALVWSDNVEDALETAAEWLAEHAPGLFTEPDACGECGGTDGEDRETCATCLGSGINEDDLTYTESGYLASWEWGVRIVSRRDILLALDRVVTCRHVHDTSAGHPSDCAMDRDLALACAQRSERQARKADKRFLRRIRNATRRANQRAMRD